MSKGFSLIEVLIALVVFAIASLGIYSLLSQSMLVQTTAWNRLSLVLETTDFVMKRWDTGFEETPGWVSLDDGIEYKVEKMPVGLYDITKVYCSFRKGGEKLTYIFYY